MSVDTMLLEEMTGPRVETSWVEWLDRDEQQVAERLAGVVEFDVQARVHSTIQVGATLRLADLGQGIDWDSQGARFRLWVGVGGRSWPLATVIPSSPREVHGVDGVHWEVPCQDKTSLIEARRVSTLTAIPKGVNAIETIQSRLGVTLTTRSALTPSPLTTRTDLFFDPDSTELRIARDLLAGINYFALWADEWGQFRAEPYRAPAARPVAWHFAAGEASLHSPEWEREQNLADVPNRVTVATRGDGEEESLIAVAVNDDPASPTSTVSRGFVVDAPVEWVEAASQEQLDDLAPRRLAEQSRAAVTFSVEHAVVPGVGLNGVVRFSPLRRESVLAVVQSWSLSSRPGSLVQAQWREVADGQG